MRKLKIKKIFVLLFCIFVSIVTAIAIPLIPIGVVKGWLWIWIASIVLTVHGAVFLPLYWVWFGGLCRCYKLVRMIETKFVYNANELAVMLNKHREKVIKDIRRCIENEWLTGMLFDGVNIYVNENTQLKTNPSNITCEYCGTFFLRKPYEYRCPNCGGPIDSEGEKEDSASSVG